MKKVLVFASLILMTSCLAVGCSSMGSCWTRSGSRVPTQSYTAAAVAPAPVVMPENIVYSSSCNPCAAVTNACDPCGTSGSTSNYPLPGMN